MDQEASDALKTIRACVEEGRYVVSRHFTARMDKRGLMWPDVLSVLEDVEDVFDDGLDREGLPKWKITGPAADGLHLELICVIERRDDGSATIFVTLYFQD